MFSDAKDTIYFFELQYIVTLFLIILFLTSSPRLIGAAIRAHKEPLPERYPREL